MSTDALFIVYAHGNGQWSASMVEEIRDGDWCGPTHFSLVVSADNEEDAVKEGKRHYLSPSGQLMKRKNKVKHRVL